MLQSKYAKEKTEFRLNSKYHSSISLERFVRDSSHVFCHYFSLFLRLPMESFISKFQRSTDCVTVSRHVFLRDKQWVGQNRQHAFMTTSHVTFLSFLSAWYIRRIDKLAHLNCLFHSKRFSLLWFLRRKSLDWTRGSFPRSFLVSSATKHFFHGTFVVVLLPHTLKYACMLHAFLSNR